MFPEKIIRFRDDYFYYARECVSGDFDMHMHTYYEFLRVVEGSLYCIVENTEYKLSSGDMIFTAPSEIHSIMFPEPCMYTRQFFQIKHDFVTSLAPDILDVIDKKPPGKNNYIPARLVSKYKLDEIFSGIHDYVMRDNEETDFMILTYSMQLVTKVSEILKYEKIKKEAGLEKNIQRAISYISEHLSEPISLDKLSESCFLNKSYLCRLFKSELGVTVGSYINMQRVVMAKNMLADGIKATEVSAGCGFSDYSTFYRAFQKYAGVTPNEFRRTYGNL